MSGSNPLFVAAGALGVAAVGLYITSSPYMLIPGLLALLAGAAGIMQTDLRRGIAATAAIAFGANAYLFSQKFASASAGGSLCNIDEVFNCDIVNSSEYSMLFGAIPITLLGMAFYAGLGLAATNRAEQTPRLFQVNTIFATINLIYSAYLGWASSQLGAFCVMCITIYLANALLFWAGQRGLRQSGKKATDGLGAALFSNSSVTIAVTFVVVSFLGQMQWSKSVDGPVGEEAQSTDYLSTLFKTPKGAVKLNGTEYVYGDPEATYTIVEWADYGCPHCKEASKTLKMLVDENPDIQLRYKYFPLSAACNPALSNDSGPERCNAAFAAECGGRQGKFYEMSHQLFINQGFFSQEQLVFMASEVGLDKEAFSTCMKDESIKGIVEAHAQAGADAGVQGTPALYLSGTHGDKFVEATKGVNGILRLVAAHRDGADLPPLK